MNPRHIRLPFMDALVLAIAANEKLETRRLTPPHAKPGDIVAVCEALVAEAADHPDDRTAVYRCDRTPVYRGEDARTFGWRHAWDWKVSTIIPRYCPTWAVRHRRRLVEVRQEPLSAITDQGARDEGIARLGWEPTREGFLRGFREFRGLGEDADPVVTVYRWAPGEVAGA